MDKQTGKPTPGPWFASDDGYIWRRPLSEVRSAAGERPIATVHIGWRGPGLTGLPQKANSALIAAAPDLLEAAQAVVERWDSPHWKDAEPTADCINRLRAAIARATGQQES